MKVIVTGATGMVGHGVLLEALDDPSISEVLSISRSSTNINHPKLKELLHRDFSDFSKADSVTIHQLLTHTSGIRDYHYFPDWQQRSQSALTPLDVINQVSTDPYRFSPGSSFRYSNTGYILLGLIIEQVTKSTFEKYIQSAILDPLHLNHTGIITNSKSVKNLAVGYTTTPMESKIADYINYNQPFSSGNMYSTCSDLRKFTLAIMKSELLPNEKTKEVFENNTGYYGYGWGIRNFDGVKAYGHHGGMNGYWGSITYIPENETFLCFLTNDYNTPKHTINRDVVSILNGNEAALPEMYEARSIDEQTIDHISVDYLVKPGDTLSVFSDSNHVFMQETGQIAYELFQVGEERFVTTIHEFDIYFNNDSIHYKGMVNLSAPKLSLSDQ